MVCITSPFHGAVLNHRQGRTTPDGLTITVRGTAPLRDQVTVNGCEATRVGADFAADVLLTTPEADVTAVATGAEGEARHTVRVRWDRYSRPRYRFSVDDNSYFLRDVAAHRYRSLFDCFYLALFRDLHQQYGAKFVLNVFFQTPEADFHLTNFPADYRAEWADHADWLKLAFHSLAEFPDRPYEHVGADTLLGDYDRVGNEILRFAGETTWSPPTVIHWGVLQPYLFPVLAQRGVRVLSGFFRRSAGGNYDVNYCLDDARSAYLNHHEALVDWGSGLVFSRVDLVVNNTPLERIAPELAAIADSPDLGEVMDLFTHEQYTWPFYSRYVPDHAARIGAAVRFCHEHGYEPVFFHEGLLGGRA